MTSTAALRAFLDRPLRTATIAVAALAAVVFFAACWFGLSWYRVAHDESLALRMARDAVLRDAQQATVNLNTLDYRRVQDGLTLWEQSATGSLRDEMQVNRGTYARAITNARTTTTARALDGAVAELDERAGARRRGRHFPPGPKVTRAACVGACSWRWVVTAPPGRSTN